MGCRSKEDHSVPFNQPKPHFEALLLTLVELVFTLFPPVVRVAIKPASTLDFQQTVYDCSVYCDTLFVKEPRHQIPSKLRKLLFNSNDNMYYSQLPTEVEEELPFTALTDHNLVPKKQERLSPWKRASTILAITSFVLSGLFVMAGLWKPPTKQQCIRKLDVWCMSLPFLSR